MNKILKFFMLGVASLFILATLASAADVAKIGIVNIQKIIDESQPGKRAQAELNNEGKKMFADIKAKGEEIEKIKSKLEKESLVTSKEKRDEEERKLQIKLLDFKALQQKYNEEVKILHQKLITKVSNEIVELVNEIGKKQGYLLILEEKSSGVIYAPSAINITDEIIKRYNAKK